jgi:pyruvate,orthophosphate dikinase
MTLAEAQALCSTALFMPYEPETDRAALITFEQVKNRVLQLHEANPLLGHRGERLAITCPEILEMQVRAIIEAACEVKKEGIKVLPEIMIPLVGVRTEIDFCKNVTIETANKVMKERGLKVRYLFGAMIQVPRAAITADEMALAADFFSFGTNTLTQTTFGFSRNDVGSFLPDYLKKEILEHDPFNSLDTDGVGKLVKMAVSLGRGVRSDLKYGICGEHGGDPKSIEFCHNVGLNYVSCSPFRVPIARLAAAQAALKDPLWSRRRKGGKKKMK